MTASLIALRNKSSKSPMMCTLNRRLQHPSHCLLHAGSFTRRTNLHAFHTTVLPVTDGSLSRPLRALHNSRPQRAPQQFNNVKLVADLLQSALFQSTQTPPGSQEQHFQSRQAPLAIASNSGSRQVPLLFPGRFSV